MSKFRLSCTTCATRGIDGDETAACFKYAPPAGFTAWGAASVAQRTLGESFWLDSEKIKKEAIKAGLIDCTEVYSCPMPPASVEKAVSSINQFLSVFELAKGLECDLVVFSGGQSPEQAEVLRSQTKSANKRERIKSIGIEASIAGIKALLPYIERSNTRIALEPHYGSNFSTRSDFDQIFKAIDHPQVGITIDTGHFHSAGVDWRTFIQDFGSKIWNVHFKDHIGTLSVPLGTGEIDFHGYLEELDRLNYEGALALELEVEDPENLPQYVSQAYKFMVQIVKEVTGSTPQ